MPDLIDLKRDETTGKETINTEKLLNVVEFMIAYNLLFSSSRTIRKTYSIRKIYGILNMLNADYSGLGHIPKTARELRKFYIYITNIISAPESPTDAIKLYNTFLAKNVKSRLDKDCLTECKKGKPSALRKERKFCKTDPFPYRGLTYEWDDCD